MIKGVKALFCTGLALLDYMKSELFEVGDLASIFAKFDETQKSDEIMNKEFLKKVGKYYKNISNDFISKRREDLR